MRLRLMGTRVECDRFVAELLAATAPGVIREVSGWYANRPPSLLGRVYLDVAIPGTPATPGASATPGTGTRPDDTGPKPAVGRRRGRRPR